MTLMIPVVANANSLSQQQAAIYICGSRGGELESGVWESRPKTNCLLMSSINNSYCVRVCVGVNIFGWVVAQINLGRKTYEY